MPTPKGPHSGDNWYPTPDKEGSFGASIALAGEEKAVHVTGMAGLSKAKQQTMGSGHGKSHSGNGGQVKIIKSRSTASVILIMIISSHLLAQMRMCTAELKLGHYSSSLR